MLNSLELGVELALLHQLDGFCQTGTHLRELLFCLFDLGV
jgi:hypothetical protein